jgi:hypothetical protein
MDYVSIDGFFFYDGRGTFRVQDLIVDAPPRYGAMVVNVHGRNFVAFIGNMQGDFHENHICRAVRAKIICA